ncbi:MAG: Maf family protein [Planctomycetota bacterium]
MPSDRSPTLVLASRSPRRRWLLTEAGLGDGLIVADPPHDDPATPDPRPGQDVAGFVAETARRKAESVVGLGSFRDAVIVAADTVCVGATGTLLGKPADRDELLRMLRGFVGATHDVVSGVAVFCVDGRGETTHREAWADAAAVTWGPLAEAELFAYADTDGWHGKAGGYNLAERVAAGWPISMQGDPATVMGLPVVRLLPRLADLGVTQPQLPGAPR